MRKILLALAALLLTAPALAQTTPNSYMALQKIGPAGIRFVQGTDSAGTYKTIYTGATNGSICFNAVANSNDQSVAHMVVMRVTLGGIPLDIATVSVGNNALGANLFGPAIGILVSNVWPSAISQAGNTYIQLKSGDTFQATYNTALTAADQINIIAQCGDF